MSWNSDTQRVEIIGRHWLIGELVRAGLEAAEPVRDDGVDLLVSPEDYTWTQPVQVKTHMNRVINVYPDYVRERHDRRPLPKAYTLLGDSQAPMPQRRQRRVPPHPQRLLAAPAGIDPEGSLGAAHHQREGRR
jgi:hypothetical protein